MNSGLSILSFFIWFFIIYFIIVVIAYVCMGSQYFQHYRTDCDTGRGNVIGVIFWIFFILLILALLFWNDDYSHCNKCNRSKCECGKNNSDVIITTFNVCGKYTKNIEINTFLCPDSGRSVARLTINGTECKNDNKFDCDPEGFSKVVNIPLPRECDALVGIDVNKPIELYQWTAPHGTEFTVNYLIPHRDFFIVVKSPENIVATGEISLKAQNNLGFLNSQFVN